MDDSVLAGEEPAIEEAELAIVDDSVLADEAANGAEVVAETNGEETEPAEDSEAEPLKDEDESQETTTV
jgi:hypothetical protein